MLLCKTMALAQPNIFRLQYANLIARWEVYSIRHGCGLWQSKMICRGAQETEGSA